jgi:hypothetical protein
MRLEKLTTEELLKNYERLCKRDYSFTKKDAEYRGKVKEELLKRFG